MNSPARPVTVLPKPEVLSALFASWDDIDRLVAPITEDQWRTPSALPGWTVHSLVAHMVGTESMLLGKPTPDAAEGLSGQDHVRNDIGAMNEAWVQHLSGESGAGLLQLFRTVTGKRRAALAAIVDGEHPIDAKAGGVGGGDNCASELVVVEHAGVTERSSDQLDLHVGITQRKKIRHALG